MINTELLVTGGLGIISTIVGSWSSWIFARKKYNAEVDSTKIENLAKIIDVLNELIKNLQERLNASLELNKNYEIQLLDYLKQLTDVRKLVTDLMMKLIELHVVDTSSSIKESQKKSK